jgi:cystathionine beta-lyase/cystathionine gamma-synthase
MAVSIRPRKGLATLLVHAGESRTEGSPVAVPVFDSASFVLGDMEHHEAVMDELSSAPYYSRGYNPTVAALEARLAAIESARRGLAFSSGMSAIVTTLLTLCRNGGHVIVSDQVFETTRLWLAESFAAGGGEFTFADFTDLGEVKAAFRPNTRAVFFEEITNPWLQVLDLQALVELAHEHEVRAVVDNTFASPALIRPIEHGADLVIHSATKYMSGHGRLIAGALVGNDEALMTEIAEHRRQAGVIITPHNAAGILQGLATLELRVERASTTALRLARLAAEHPATVSVNYPGLPDCVGHDVATRLTGGRYGGMFSFALADPARKAAVYDAFKLIVRATSLGDVVSLVDSAHTPDVLRISTGIEDPDDLAADLTQALDAAL